MILQAACSVVLLWPLKCFPCWCLCFFGGIFQDVSSWGTVCDCNFAQSTRAPDSLQEQGCSFIYSQCEAEDRALELGFSALSCSPFITQAYLILCFSNQSQAAPRNTNLLLFLWCPFVNAGNRSFFVSIICLVVSLEDGTVPTMKWSTGLKRNQY